MTSCPGWVWLSRAQRLPMVPLGTKSEASLPTISAARCWRRWIVGSSSQTSSPTSAAAMAARIESVGSVKVSLRSSIARFMVPRLQRRKRVGPPFPCTPADQKRCLPFHWDPAEYDVRVRCRLAPDSGGSVGGGLNTLEQAAFFGPRSFLTLFSTAAGLAEGVRYWT